MDDMFYQFENWMPPNVTLTESDYTYRSLLSAVIGENSVLLFIQKDDDWRFRGDWAAVVSDGKRIGLVNGCFGSCDGCDDLKDAAHPQGHATFEDLASRYLQSVRTFRSWAQLQSYVEQLGDNWNFRFGRQEIMELARVDMPLGAVDIFGRLIRDSPDAKPWDVALTAKALHED